MRLQLILRLLVCVLCGILAAPRAAAQTMDVLAVDARTSAYADDDDTFIGTTLIAGRVEPVSHVTVSGRYLVDVITTASVDVVSAATGRWEETRHEGLGGLAWADGTNTVSAAYVYSVENDWRSHTGNLGLARDFFDHRLTLGLGATAVFNAVGRADDPNFAEANRTLSGSVSAAVVATKDDLWSLTYSLISVRGYQASPYRFVRFDGPIDGVPIGQPEELPEQRYRHALGLRYNRHLFRDSSLRSHLRGYLDDWGIVSGTAGTELVVGHGILEAGPFVRGYLQSGAAFYRGQYRERRLYMTSDRELGPFADAFGGARVALLGQDVGPFAALRAEARASAFVFSYFDFPAAPHRRGLTADLALGASF